MQALGWIIWAVAVLVSIGGSPHALRSIVNDPGVTPAILIYLVLTWGGVIAVPIFGYSPFHLLWLFPAALLVSLIAAGIMHHITGPGRELRKRKQAS
jgi:hypothetical protein